MVKATGSTQKYDDPGLTDGRHAYWVSAGVASLAMSSWELLNFWALVAAYDISPIPVGPFLYFFILLVSLGSLTSGFLVLVRKKHPGRKLAALVAGFAVLGLVLFFLASLPSASGWGFFYFLEGACIIVPVLILITIAMRRPKHVAPTDSADAFQK
ncbi:uncharacterized membrane protein YhaH (DUF805 family) [Arthrobacter sp. UYNi723]